MVKAINFLPAISMLCIIPPHNYSYIWGEITP